MLERWCGLQRECTRKQEHLFLMRKAILNLVSRRFRYACTTLIIRPKSHLSEEVGICIAISAFDVSRRKGDGKTEELWYLQCSSNQGTSKKSKWL